MDKNIYDTKEELDRKELRLKELEDNKKNVSNFVSCVEFTWNSVQIFTVVRYLGLSKMINILCYEQQVKR